MKNFRGLLCHCHFVCLFALARVASAQLEQIDAAKLPQSADVQSAYRNALGVEQYAQSWGLEWHYSVRKADVVKTLTASLYTLQRVNGSAGDNHELQLATGLVAHFAYNLDVESAYEPAVEFLTKALKNEPSDIRGQWFLGIHECQALQVVSGMNRLLAVEATGKNLPADFWDDYIACANVAILPAHALRAIDRAVELGRSREGYQNVQEIAETRYRTADLTKPVDEHDAWISNDMPGNQLKFTSRLCGVSFVASWSWNLQVAKVSDGTCKVGLTPPPAKKGQPSATILVMAKIAKDGQTLDSFARGLLENRSDAISNLNGALCPVEHCVALQLVDKSVYSKQGGVHALVIAFERELPRYDGLLFETPQGPPTTGPTNKPVAFTFPMQYRRMPGEIFYAILLDANAQIYDGSKPDWDAVLRSIVVE